MGEDFRPSQSRMCPNPSRTYFRNKEGMIVHTADTNPVTFHGRMIGLLFDPRVEARPLRLSL